MTEPETPELNDQDRDACGNCAREEPDVGVTGLCPECGTRLVACDACEKSEFCVGHW